MNLKSVVMMISTMIMFSASSIRIPGSREDQQIREVVRFIAEVQDFMTRKGLLPEKSRSLIGGHIPCAANTIRGLLGSCRQHKTVKRKHSALHGLKALLAKRKKENENMPDKSSESELHNQGPIKDLSSTTAKTERTTETVTDPVTIIPGLDVFEELSVNSSVTSDDPDLGSVPTSTIITVISPFRKAISAVSEAIRRITASVSGSFSSGDISGEQTLSHSQATEGTTEETTGDPEKWETNTTLQSEPGIQNTTSETVALSNENNKALTSDVVVTKIFEMLQDELSNETKPQQSSIITGSPHPHQHLLAHELEQEEADEAEDTTDSTPTIQEDELDTSLMRGRTDLIEDQELSTELYPDAEDSTDSLLLYEDLHPTSTTEQTSKIEFLNDDGEIEILKL